MGSHTIAERHGRANVGDVGGTRWTDAGRSAPRLVQWMVTARCGLACPHCLADAGAARPNELSTAEALALLDEIAALGPGELLLTGGEPLLRHDLPLLIDRLAAAGVRWSLNTSGLPTAEVRRALERHPPAFVAVSIDGPAETHDAFRGRRGALDDSLAAIELFAALGCTVAAGTTVTRRNFRALPETLGLVARTRASSWGLHLLVPEGRARTRRSLFLRRPELRHLLRFVADKRRYFPVVMADEFGFCGDWEPLVRDAPWRCGAGRMQCVVLPDGEVVPCTTLDRSTSAGNVRRRALRELWRDGFAELRAERPQGRCRRCEHFADCGGGCWLHRRHGAACLRDVWNPPGPLARATGALVALGLALAPARAQETPAEQAPTDAPEATDSPVESSTLLAPRPSHCGVPSPQSEAGPGIEAQILLWRTSARPDPRPRDGFDRDSPAFRVPATVNADGTAHEDPGWRFFREFVEGSGPDDLAGRLQAVRNALGTDERSLGLAALLFQGFGECLLDGPEAASRTEEQRTAIRETLAALRTAVERWRREILEGRLEPYLARHRHEQVYFFEMCKAMIPPPSWLPMARETAVERWGRGGEASEEEEVDAWLARHPYADALALTIVPAADGLRLEGAADPATAGSALRLGIHDLLLVPEGEAPARADVRWGDTTAYGVTLPADTELTWADVVRLVYEQNSALLDALAETNPASRRSATHAESNPLFLPALRAHPERPGTAGWLADFWLF